jgi:hypothetical protein
MMSGMRTSEKVMQIRNGVRNVTKLIIVAIFLIRICEREGSNNEETTGKINGG